MSAPYIGSYQLAYIRALRELRQFRGSRVSQLRYAAKAGNLATCFLGFSIHRGEEYYQRAADLGVLASIFDLASDGLNFDCAATDKFRHLSLTILGGEAADILFALMDQKKAGAIPRNGLDRGIAALRVILKHLDAEEAWASDNQIARSGILLQVVDDVLDYSQDITTAHLNFLRYENSSAYINALLEWDFETQLHAGQHTLVLFHAIRRAKAIANDFAKKQSAPMFADS